MSEANYKPTGALQGDTKPMPNRGSGSGVTDTYGASVDQNSTNAKGGISGATGSDPMEQCKSSSPDK